MRLTRPFYYRFYVKSMQPEIGLFSCFEKNIVIFFSFENIFLKSRECFSINIELLQCEWIAIDLAKLEFARVGLISFPGGGGGGLNLDQTGMYHRRRSQEC